MQVTFGGSSFDLGTRVLVVGRLAAADEDEGAEQLVSRGEALVAAGADLIAVDFSADGEPAQAARPFAALHRALSTPLGTTAASRAGVSAASTAGAAFVRLAVPADPELVAAATSAGLVVVCDQAVAASPAPANRCSPATTRWPLMAVLPARPLPLGATVGLAVGAVIEGCRLLCGPDVRTLRRTADVCSDLLAAR